MNDFIRHIGITAMVAAALDAGAAAPGVPSTSKPPPHAIGFASAAPDLDVLPGFRKPPPGFGEVAFYWWVGDPLTQERLSWQLDQLARVPGVMGLQVNYAHTDRGGRSYGLSMPSEPPLFSEEWWKLFGWFLQQAKQRGMAVSLSDYTLGIGQGWFMDEVLDELPGLRGATLSHAARPFDGGQHVVWEVPENTISLTAWRLKDGAIEAGSGVDLRAHISNRALRWPAPAGHWQVVAVTFKVNPYSIDPMNPLTGPKIIEKFFQRFEDRNPGEPGRGLNFFFSDELDFGVHGNLWNARFADEFRRRKGYDLLPELAALFTDIGPRTSKVRLDYRDVMTALTEEGYFRPVFEWHQARGMIYGCDHGGRGRNVTEFGDYFRTQRWMNGPGCDQPGLSSDLIKNKVASSIAHLYRRPRVWLEGYYGSGWGTTSAQLADATFRNFAQGQNLLTLHGLYYTTHGGWWEWAPPCNHFRMPYWPHLGGFMECVQRLSYLLSQGVHRCDVAIVYPVAPMEADLGGNESVNAAFNLGRHLYSRGIDFDFIDFESLARARTEEKELQVAGEAYRVLVLPAMRAVRFSTMQKAADFARGGGIVVALGALPEASDRAGRDDPQLDALVKETFGLTAHEQREGKPAANTQRAGAGRALLAQKNEQVEVAVVTAFPRDFECAAANARGGQPFFMHRRIGPRDVFMVYGAPAGAECSFRATGRVELWDPWTGGTRPLPALAQTAQVSRLRLPLTEKEAQLIVFSPGAAEIEPAAAPTNAASIVALDGEWDFELQPTLDNRFGDFHWPPFNGLVGAEARQFRYADETSPNPGWERPDFDDSKWNKVTCSFGPRFWKLGPLPADVDATVLERGAGNSLVPPKPVELGGRTYRWQPYEFSWRWGVEGDPGHQGYHGLKEQVSDDFIALGKRRFTSTSSTYEKEDAGPRYYLWTAAAAEREMEVRALAGGLKPTAVWLNQTRLGRLPAKVRLREGANPLLLRYDAPGRGHFALGAGQGNDTPDDSEPFSAAAFWIWFPDDAPGVADRFFRKSFSLTDRPAQARVRVTCDNAYTLFVNGHEAGRGHRWEAVQEYDVARHLLRGTNTLAVLGHNDGDAAGLIAELTLTDATGAAKRIASDATWLCARTEAPGWRDITFNDASWARAKTISRFEDSLWFKHQFGPPRLEALHPPEEPSSRGSLAMRWHRRAGIVPFDTRPAEPNPAGWYRFLAPPGLRGLTITALGRVQAWAGGQPLGIVVSQPREDGTREFKATTPQVFEQPVVVALRIEQERGSYGGAALPEPIRIDCAPGRLAPGDWSKIDGLATFSGGAWYRRTFSLSAEQTRGRVLLDLGELAASAEVRINGQPAGVRAAPPWRVDVTGFAKTGENRVEILVFNTLANHYLTIPTRYRGSPVSGLLGPVRVECRSR